MRIFEIFENNEPSDDELFGAEISNNPIGSSIRAYGENIIHSCGKNPSGAFAASNEYRNAMRKGERIIKLGDLFSRNAQKGLDQFNKLPEPTQREIRGWLEDDVEYIPNGNELYKLYFGDYLTENEPSDDELFGTPSSTAEKYGMEMEAYAENLEMSASEWIDSDGETAEQFVEDMFNDAKIIRNIGNIFRKFGLLQGITEFKKLPHPLQDDIRQWLHTNDMEEFDDYLSESEPNDEELFGNRSTVVSHKIIQVIENTIFPRNVNRINELLRYHNVSSVGEINGDTDDNLDDISELRVLMDHNIIMKRFIKEFKIGLEEGLRYYVRCMREHEGTDASEMAEYIEYKLYNEANINLAELSENILGEKL